MDFEIIEPEPFPAVESMHVREPFRFIFKGYSIWLELSQTDRDLEKACTTAALDNALHPIPEPHCTVLYGVSHMTEEQVKQCFRDKVVPAIKHWPALETKGRLLGVSYDGVDGEEMDMSWIELSLNTSPDHEDLVDKVHSCFYDAIDCDPVEYKTRTGPWAPHVSIVYDNPEDSILDDIYTEKIFAHFPTLLGTKKRDVVGISLWSTTGKVHEWECIDRHLFK